MRFFACTPALAAALTMGCRMLMVKNEYDKNSRSKNLARYMLRSARAPMIRFKKHFGRYRAAQSFSNSPVANEPDFNKMSEYGVCHQHGREQRPIGQRKRLET